MESRIAGRNYPIYLSGFFINGRTSGSIYRSRPTAGDREKYNNECPEEKRCFSFHRLNPLKTVQKMGEKGRVIKGSEAFKNSFWESV